MANQQLPAFLDRLREAALRQDGAPLSDGELLERFITRREEAAFEALMRRHGAMVLGVCRRLLHNEADAEDAFQATFLVLATKAAGVRPRALVGNWLYGVARHTALKAKAMTHRRCQREREAGARRTPQPAEDSGQELQMALDQELSALPEKYRAPLILCELEGKTIQAAARQLDWPQGTMATRLRRGRALLGRRLLRYGLAAGGGIGAQVQASAAAGVPARLLVSTVQAATSVVAGQAAAVGLISARVVALKEGVVKAMLLTKLKTMTTVILAVALLGGGGVLVTLRSWAGEPQDVPGETRADGRVPDDQKAKSDRERFQRLDRELLMAVVDADQKAKSDKGLLQGTWVEESRGAGEGEQVAENDRWQLVFDGDKVSWVHRGKEREGICTLDPDRKPKEIDLTLANPTLVLNGIYELNGDTLKTLWRENDRTGLPKTFDAKEGVLIVFKKKK
jgi:RNA polymerase sigma-70 factor (ECF subfamily)